MGLGHQLLVLAIYVLAIARLTRLINSDTVFDPVRLIPIRKLREAQDAAAEATMHGQLARSDLFAKLTRRWSTLVYFLDCPWCVGFWLALTIAIVPTWIIGWPWWAALPVGLAASHLVGVFAFAADTEETEVVEDA